jgi:uncharacterized membrane protein YgdD (TMEM256/DUF423 family)
LIWNRRLWMRLGVLNALCSVVIALLAFRLDDAAAASLLRLGAGFQFMHSLSTFTCATFMNIGANEARHAPALFLLGSALFSGSLYARASGVWDGGDLALGIGAALMAGGWGVLFVASDGIDRDV